MKSLTLKCIGVVLTLCVSGAFATQRVHGQGVAYLSNIDQPVTMGNLTGSFSIDFTTGTDPSGYLLDSLTVLFGNNSTPVLMTAALDDHNTITGFQEGVEVGAAGDYTFTPSSPLALAANTQYALMVNAVDALVSVNVSDTSSSDYTSVDNWNIPGLLGFGEPLFTITATPAPEPSVAVLAFASILGFIAFRLDILALGSGRSALPSGAATTLPTARRNLVTPKFRPQKV